MKVTRGGLKLTSAEILGIVVVLVGVPLAFLFSHHQRQVQVRRKNLAKETVELLESVVDSLRERAAIEE